MHKLIGLGMIASVLTLVTAIPALAAAPPAIRESVAVCDPNAPSHCVAPNSSGGTPTSTLPSGVTSTDASFTVTLGGTYQTVLAASATRKSCTFQNPSTATEVVTFKVGTQATAYTISAGQSFSCATTNGLVVTDAITATAATTSHAVAGNSQ